MYDTHLLLPRSQDGLMLQPDDYWLTTSSSRTLVSVTGNDECLWDSPPPPQQQPQPQRKRVSFDEGANQVHPRTSACSNTNNNADKNILYPKDIKATWWSARDYKRFKANLHVSVRQIDLAERQRRPRQQQEQYHQHHHHHYSCCQKSSYVNVMTKMWEACCNRTCTMAGNGYGVGNGKNHDENYNTKRQGFHHHDKDKNDDDGNNNNEDYYCQKKLEFLFGKWVAATQGRIGLERLVVRELNQDKHQRRQRLVSTVLDLQDEYWHDPVDARQQVLAQAAFEISQPSCLFATHLAHAQQLMSIPTLASSAASFSSSTTTTTTTCHSSSCASPMSLSGPIEMAISSSSLSYSDDDDEDNDDNDNNDDSKAIITFPD